MQRLGESFFHRPCLTVAQELVGKVLVTESADKVCRLRISETEAYCGETDTACHASKGKTKRTKTMYDRAGTCYVYLCYGIHWMLNVVTGEVGQPEAVLIRACVDANGPGKLTKHLGITGEINGRDICTNTQIRIEDDGFVCTTETAKRVGIDYASQEDREKPWRFVMKVKTD